MIETIQAWDNNILLWIQATFGSPFFDSFFGFITNFHKNTTFSVPLAVVILGLLIYRLRVHCLGLLLALALAVALSDMICYRVFKKSIERPRPSQNIELIASGLQIKGVAHGTSFPSNHAANCFAAAAILAWYFRRSRYYFYTFAGIIGLSRIYLGVHYPSDVVAGAMLGIFVGMLVRKFLLMQRDFFQMKKSRST